MSEMDIEINHNNNHVVSQPFFVSFKYQLNTSNVINKVYLSYDDNILLINEFLTILNNPELQITFPHMNTWDLNIYEYDANHMILLTIKIMQFYNFFSLYHISLEKWIFFLLNIHYQMQYSNNPYHNFRHVIDVFQSCHTFIQEFDIKCLLKPIDILSFLLSALLHDLNHPGLNNFYQINAMTSLAILYNDNSVLENHHCSAAFQLLQSPNCDILSSLSKEEFLYLRRTIIKSILNTDMAHHFTIKAEYEKTLLLKLSNLTSFIEEKGFTYDSDKIPSELLLQDNERYFLVSMLLHAADISNPCKPWIISKAWSDCINLEFFAQGDKEKVEKLPVTNGCDRERVKQDEASLNFTDFIITPFFVTLSKSLKKFALLCKHIHINRNHWHEQVINRLVHGSSGGMNHVQDTINFWNKRKEQSDELLSKYLV